MELAHSGRQTRLPLVGIGCMQSWGHVSSVLGRIKNNQGEAKMYDMPASLAADAVVVLLAV